MCFIRVAAGNGGGHTAGSSTVSGCPKILSIIFCRAAETGVSSVNSVGRYLCTGTHAVTPIETVMCTRRGAACHERLRAVLLFVLSMKAQQDIAKPPVQSVLVPGTRQRSLVLRQISERRRMATHGWNSTMLPSSAKPEDQPTVNNEKSSRSTRGS